MRLPFPANPSMAADAPEAAAAQPLRDIELYDFDSGHAQFRLTPHEFDVDLPEGLYRSAPIERSALALGAEDAKSALALKLPPDHALTRHLLQAAITGEAVAARLLCFRPRENIGGYNLWTRWMGRVLGVEVSDEAAHIRCESALASFRRIGLRRLYSRACSHVLYSAACGATPIAASAVASHVSGRFIDLQDGVPASVDGGLAGGWLQTPAGARHMIVSDYGSGVELLYPAPLAIGAEVLLTVGCDKSRATCLSRFDNLANYGGFPFIPTKNPFATGVF